MSLRDLSDLHGRAFDAAVLGGGVQGACLALYLAARGARTILIEKSDFGSGASGNSLRILHGGLRYLQTLDLYRFYSSVNARRWFFQYFPDLVRPLRCVMPLVKRGARNPALMRAALGMNDLLSLRRNKGVSSVVHLPKSAVHSIRDLDDCEFELDDFQNGSCATWYDGAMQDSARLLVEILRWSESHGAIHINYADPIRLTTANGAVSGVVFRDLIGRAEIEIKARLVFNATGADVTNTLKTLHVQKAFEIPHLLAWNVLVDRYAPDGTAFAVTSKGQEAHTYFLCPWKGRWLIGTGQVQTNSNSLDVSTEDMSRMLADINSALPSMGLRDGDLLRIYSGLLPSAAYGDARLRKWPRILDHGEKGGPRGLVSISSVKFTTASQVAQSAISRTMGKSNGQLSARPEPAALTSETLHWQYDYEPSEKYVASALDWKSSAESESVWFIDDLLLRRTSIGENVARAWRLAPILMTKMGWPAGRQEDNMARLGTIFGETISKEPVAEISRIEPGVT